MDRKCSVNHKAFAVFKKFKKMFPKDSPLARGAPEPVERPPTPLPTPAALDLIPVMDDEITQKKEAQLRQFSFFQLRIHLKRGQNLVAMDKNGTSDPYVKFKTGGRLLHKSKTIYRDLNPVWDETFTVPIEDPFQPIHIKVFDYDWGLQDDFMGSCYLDLTALELGRPQDLLLCLQDPNKSALTQDMGEVILCATLWPRTQEDKEQDIPKEQSYSIFKKIPPRGSHSGGGYRVRRYPAIRMAENEESKIQRVKNRLTKMHDKLQSKVEDIYEDLQETVHLASPKVNKFVSHLSQAKGEKLKKSESVETINQRSSTRPEDTVERSSSLENLQAPSAEDEPVQKLRLSSKIKILKQMLKKSMNSLDDDTDNELKLSKSEISLLRKELFSNEEDTRHHVKIHTIDVEDGASRQRKLSRESEAFESDESFKDPASDGEEKHVVVEDDGAVSDTSATSKKSESRSEKEPSTGSPHLEPVPTSGGHLPLPCEILERLGNRFPKIKEKSDMVHRYFQRNTRLCDVNKRLKCQIWSSVVTIVLVEAKGLTPMDQDTGSSDPYCKFRLGNEKYKSKVIWRSLNPCWLEQFDLHLYDDQEQLLELTMWDRDKQSKDDFLGRCVIDLSMLEREKTHSIRQDLEDNNGQVFLLLTISGTTSSETITDLTNYQDNPRERKNIEDKYAWHRLDIWNETGSGGVGWLCVKVFGAKGLAAADLGGKSDPFCVLELVNSRLQTHTEYKTLQPNWMKIFTFNVKDITSVLEITVYDEDHDHKVEFLGKLAIPLLNIKNGDKRWYSLKDKKMRARAKGNCPQILLEMTVIWNPIKACVRALNPREDKYMHTEIKFKRQVFLRNVIRLKSIIVWFIEIGKILQACFEWESRIRSFVALLGWIVACYYFEPWMAPFGLLLLFGRNWLFIWLTGGSSYLQQPIDDEELLAEEDDDDPEQDKEEKKSLKERLQAIQEVTQSVQNSIGFMASLGEEVKNLFNFTVPNLSWLAILLLLAASFVLFLIPVRFLLMLWGINKFARKILRPHTIPNNEVLDLLSRVPDDEELLDFRELKTHSNNEPRRDARKKHKVT